MGISMSARGRTRFVPAVRVVCPVAVRRLVGVAVLCVLWPAAVAETWAQEGRPGFAREGMYVGVAGLLASTFDGTSFDGMTFYEAESSDEVFILPEIDDVVLRRIVVGFRARAAALEFSYDRARHRGTFLDASSDAVFNSVNVDVRVFGLTDGRIQPHAVVGLAFPWLTVEDGSFLDPDAGDARFRGQGVNTEVGVTVFVTPRVGVGIGYTYRIFWFNRVRGVGDESFRLDPRFRETNGTAVMMGVFTF